MPSINNAFSIVAIACSTVFVSQANAALLGASCFQPGNDCPVELALSTSSAQFTVDGDGSGGTLVLLGTAGNATLTADAVLDGVALTSLLVQPGPLSLNNDFSFSVKVDGNGDYEGLGSFSLNGRINGGFNPGLVSSGYSPFNPVIAANGTVLDGVLMSGDLSDSGSVVTGNILRFDFLMDLDASSVFSLAEYGSIGQGNITLTTDVTNSANTWNTNWSGSNVTFGTAVPVPAAAWLFASALLGMVGLRRR
jgi:hypothetical protein